MTITEIKKIGKGDRYYIFIDDQKNCILEAETLVRSGLRTGQEIEEDYLKELQLESGKLHAFERAITYLEKGMKTIKGMRDYLKEKGYIKETIDETIDKLIEYNYLNDAFYTESYINTYRDKKGKKLLKLELKSKGIDLEIIEQALEELDEQSEAAIALAEKFVKTKKDDEKLKQKLFAHLASKGFSSSEIQMAIRKTLGGSHEDWD